MPQDAEIASLLNRLASLTKEGGKEGVQEVLDELEGLAQQHGLDHASLAKGYRLALGGQLGTQQALQLLSALLPRAPLAASVIALTLSVLGEATHSLPLHGGKVDYKVQRRAIEQLGILVELGAVDKDARDALDRLYGVLERGLQYRTLREPTAALLCQITRRHHVQPHRIDDVHALLQHDPSPPASLLRLLEEYRSYEPERVFESRKRASGRMSRSKALEKWRQIATAILEPENAEVDSEGRKTKRRKTSKTAQIPLPTTQAADGSARTETPLADIHSLSVLCDTVDTVAMPTQAASVLSAVPGATGRSRPRNEEDRVRAWGFLLRSGYDNDPEHLARLSHWLVAQLSHELYDSEPSTASEARVEDLLCRARELSELGGELVEALEPFLAEYLIEWNGEQHRSVIFDLVALLKPFVWKDLEGHFLHKLRTLATAADAKWNADLVACLGSLVRNLAVRDNWEAETPVATAFGEVDDGAPYVEALERILRFADEIILAATQRFSSSLVFRTAALSFYESALLLPLELDLPVLVLPSPAFVYLCLLSNEVMSVSRICGIIARLRDALTGSSSALTRSEEGSSPELIATLNERVIEAVNTLWQKKFLGAGMSLGLPSETLDPIRKVGEERGQQVGNCQSLTTHGALAMLARDCLAVLAGRQGKSAAGLVGPVSFASLKQLAKDPGAPNIAFNEFRPAFVEYLDAKGAKGLSDFLFSSLQSLVTRRMSAGSA